ncbi:MAG: NAD-dependent epimerase/dehydratase family protein [Desulfobacterales bacterium]
MSVSFNKALVTGGAGFIGSHLVGELVAQGCRVTVLDNFSTGHRTNLTHVAGEIDLIEGDIRDLQALTTAARGCEVIFHLAAVVSVPQTVAQPLESALVNELGTLHVLEAGRGAGTDAVVLASSSAVYGDDPDSPKHESLRPKPLSPYAVQKITGEYYARIYHELYGLKTTSLRFFNVFGPRQDPSSPYSGVISIFMSKAVARTAPVINGDGRQSRDFVYVGDVVRALIAAAGADAAAGRSINVGTGTAIDINRLWQIIEGMAGLRIAPSYGPPRAGDIVASVAAVDTAQSLMGFTAEVPFEEGLERTFQWYAGSHK